MKRCLIVLFCLSGHLPSNLAAGNVHCRVVCIEKKGADTALATADSTDDAGLLESLLQAVSKGEATIVSDQTLQTKSGLRAKVESYRSTPEFGSFHADYLAWMLLPGGIGRKQVGASLEIDVLSLGILVGTPGNQLISLTLASETTEKLTDFPWPIADLRAAGKMGATKLPIFSLQRISRQQYLWTGRTLLLGVSTNPKACFEGNESASFRYTFVRAGCDGEKPFLTQNLPPSPPLSADPFAADPFAADPFGTPPQEPMPLEGRLHVLRFRVSLAKALRLLWTHEVSDAALWDAIRRQGTLVDHCMIGAPSGQRAKIESIAEFPNPDPKDDEALMPANFESVPVGTSVEVDTVFSVDAQSKCFWTLAYDWHAAPEMLAFRPSADLPHVYRATPEFLNYKLTSGVNMPSSGVLCAGFATPAASEGEPEQEAMVDVVFYKQQANFKPSEQSRRNQTTQALVLSLPAEAGQAWEAAWKGHTADPLPLVEQALAGEIPIVAYAGLPHRLDSLSRVRYAREVQHPTAFQPAQNAPQVKIPSSWTKTLNGVVLDIDPKQNQCELRYETAPPLDFGPPGQPHAKITDRLCNVELKLTLPSARNTASIADVRPSNARVGSQEHGRWHVTVLLVK